MPESTDAGGVVAALATATTARSLYPAAHPRCERACSALAEALEASFETGRSELTVLVVEGEMVVDGETLRGSVLRGHGLTRSLARFGIERLTLKRGIDTDELGALLGALGGAAVPTGSKHIVLGRVMVAETLGGDGSGTAGAPQSAPAGGTGSGSTGGLDEQAVAGLEGGFSRLGKDLRAAFADLDRQMWQIVEATARESRSLVLMGDLRTADETLHRHSIAVSLGTVAFARALAVDDAMVHDLALAGLLHDIGLLGLPRELVFGRGPRDAAAQAELRRHPELGAMHLCGIPDIDALPIAVALEHHLWADGSSGYPQLGRKPSFAARLVAVVDSWDMLHAATAGHPREKRRAWVAAELRRRAGTWLDKELVERFLELLAAKPDQGAAGGAP